MEEARYEATASPAALPQSTPSETTATYGAWTLRCKQAADAPKLCEVIQIIRPKGTQIVAQIAIGKPQGSDGKVMVFQVPQGTYLPFGVKLRIGESDLMKAEYITCLEGFCLAQVGADDATLKTLAQNKTGKMRFQDRSRRTIDVIVSLVGLTDALAAQEQGN